MMLIFLFKASSSYRDVHVIIQRFPQGLGSHTYNETDNEELCFTLRVPLTAQQPNQQIKKKTKTAHRLCGKSVVWTVKRSGTPST